MKKMRLHILVIILVNISGLVFAQQNDLQKAGLAHRFFEQASGFYNSGNYDKAIEQYTNAIKTFPMASFYAARGNCYIEMGQPDRGIADCNQAIRMASDNAYAYLTRGNGYFDKNEINKAIADYTQAIKLEKNNREAYNNRAAAHYRNGDDDLAVADWEEVLKIDPKDEETKKKIYSLRPEKNPEYRRSDSFHIPPSKETTIIIPVPKQN
jgi:tetratricopeptide (TPR) repeat protein